MFLFVVIQLYHIWNRLFLFLRIFFPKSCNLVIITLDFFFALCYNVSILQTCVCDVGKKTTRKEKGETKK